MRTTSFPTSTRRSHRRKTWPTAAWLAVSAGLIVLAFLGTSGSGSSDATDDEILYDPNLAIAGVVFYGLLVAISFAIASGFPRRFDALGFRRFRMKWVWISLAVVVATTIVAVATEPFLHGGEEQGLGAERWEPEHAGAFAANVLILVLVGPFAEELFFRGIGVRVLTVFGGIAAVLISGGVFGLVHGILGALPPLVLFGIGLAWVRLRSASVWPSFIGHAGYNGLGILLLVLAWATDTPVR